MIKSIVLTASALCGLSLLVACNTDCVTGSGNEISQVRATAAFSSIEISGSIKLVVRQDSVQEVKVLAEDNIQEYIKTRTSGNKLVIIAEGNICNAGPVTVYVAAKHFSGIKASGYIEILGEGRINTSDFYLDLSGSSNVSLELFAASVSTKSSGSSSITLKGQARSHEVSMSGSGDISAGDFVVADYAIESSGSSKCLINVLNKLDVRSSGSSDVDYKGNPSTVTNHDSGSSTLRKID